MHRPVVFVTGAGRGVGRAIALRFASAGYAVGVAGRNKAAIEAVTAEVTTAGSHAFGVRCDVTEKASVTDAIADVDRQLGPIDVLVNNAGIADSAPFVTMDDAVWERMLAVNLTGTYYCMRAVLPGMFDRRRGRWGGRDPHDRVEVDGPVEALACDLLHLPYRSFDDHLRTIDRYAGIMAEELWRDGRRARLWDIVLRPPLRFLSFYVLRGGFRDGWRGLLLAYLAAHYVRLRYVKLWLRERG